MAKELFLEVGQIVGTHGVRGEVRLQPWCDAPQSLSGVHTLYFDKGTRAVGVSCRPHQNLVLVKLEGVNSLQEAETLRSEVLYVRRDDMPLPVGRYFISDLIGLPVVDDDTGKVYGTCIEVSATASNNNYHIRTPEGREILIPAIPDVIRKVDTDGGEIRIFPMLGLFDDES